MAPGPTMCPVYEISREDFRRPFTKWVGDVFRANPDLPMFKVSPPKGWSPRLEEGPVPLDDVTIQAPITQHAFGTRGTYRCVLVENKTMGVADFKKRALAGGHRPPLKEHEDDQLIERAFWRSITLNPPLYGSDNPWSLFDKKMRWGWNLRNLGDMLQDPHMDPIPGVTTPMVYFGMWKSFFCWHTEDCDLFSINYLHTGAPKAWYCIAPSDRAKFEAMARKEFPALYNNCKGFLRHKDLMFSPSMLRTHNVPFMQAKQMEGEFIVLNAGAYHAGFNMGFNCAEAINFAIPEWIPVGRVAMPCTCDALQDRVCIDMRLWCPDIPEHKEEEEVLQQSLTPPPSQPRKRCRTNGAGTRGVSIKGVRKKLCKAAGKAGCRGSKPATGSSDGAGVRKVTSRATGRSVGRTRKDGVHVGSQTLLGVKVKASGKVATGTAAKRTEFKHVGLGGKAALATVGAREQYVNLPRSVKMVAGHVGSREAKARSGGSKQGRDAKVSSSAPHRKSYSVTSRVPLPSYLQTAAVGQGAANLVAPGRRTATSARAVGKRSLRSTVPVLPHDVGLPIKLPRAPHRVKTPPPKPVPPGEDASRSGTAPDSDAAFLPCVPPRLAPNPSCLFETG
jgi:jumonji domain-containing protein 2